MANQQRYFLVALRFRNKSLQRVGKNEVTTGVRFAKVHSRYATTYTAHAEQDALINSQPGDEITVLRFTRTGTVSASFPCKYCWKSMAEAKIKSVTFVDWNGDFYKVRITKQMRKKILGDFKNLPLYPYHLVSSSIAKPVLHSSQVQSAT